nr:DUF6882 domain-containing protein [Mucilaginibacter terrenus]
MKLYDIDTYEEWFYDHSIGAFHFKSSDGRNLFFKYVDVGSFSTKTDTWNWGWANTSTPKHVSRPLEKVRQIGSINNFEELTSGLYKGDEFTGWAMTAISANLLNAIGSYRIPHKHLFVYFIFTNELTLEEYNQLKDKYVDCASHIADRTAFVCQHLLNEKSIGFNEPFETDPSIENNDDCQAWCDECEKVRLKEGEWTDNAVVFANIKVVCNQCYFDIKEKKLKA